MAPANPFGSSNPPADPGVRALLETRTVEQPLTPHVYRVSPDATLDGVIDLMLNQHVHRLPVVRNGKLVGLVSTLDMLREIRDQRQLCSSALEGFDLGL